jgi:tripartite-type tricarboxylate transporter receptor subunit TctC
MFRFVTAAAIAVCMLGGSASAADEFPNRPIKIVVPFAVGGTADPMARGIAEIVRQKTNAALVVESKPGGGGNLGAQDVARARDEGHTVLLGANNNFVVNQFTMPKTSIDPERDLTLITILAEQPQVVYVRADFPAKTMKELVAHIKANPGQVNFASPGVGSAPHLAAELLGDLYDLKMLHIPFRGGAPAITALLAGDVQLYMASLSVGKGQIDGGKLRALAVTAPNRMKSLPDVPTMAEAGFPEYTLSNWWALASAKGTPAAHIEWLRQHFIDAVNEPTLKARLEDLGFVIYGSTAAQFEDRVQKEGSVYRGLVSRRSLVTQ